jgi:hypothetical protein
MTAALDDKNHRRKAEAKTGLDQYTRYFITRSGQDSGFAGGTLSVVCMAPFAVVGPITTIAT